MLLLTDPNGGYRKHVRGIAAAIVVYASTYFMLTLNGRYSLHPVPSGNTRIGSGFAIRDVCVWEPKWVKLLPADYNYLGGFYYGLVWLDRKFWHKDIPLYPNQ